MVFSCCKRWPNKAIKRHKLQLQNQYKTNHGELQGLLDPPDHEYLHGPPDMTPISASWTFKFLVMFLRVLNRLISLKSVRHFASQRQVYRIWYSCSSGDINPQLNFVVFSKKVGRLQISPRRGTAHRHAESLLSNAPFPMLCALNRCALYSLLFTLCSAMCPVIFCLCSFFFAPCSVISF